LGEYLERDFLAQPDIIIIPEKIIKKQTRFFVKENRIIQGYPV
jgi:hypothetical protein